MRRRFALVFNKRAGSAWPRLLSKTLAELRGSGAEVLELETASAADATRQVAGLARTSSVDAVIAAGGDGTIRAVAAGAAGTELAVGFIPLGTGNVMKFEVGLKARARDVADTLLNGPEIEAQGGLVNGAPFFLMVGAGFDARIVAALSQETKRFLGRAAYGGPVIRTLAAGPDRLDVDVDGAKYAASWVIVSNASRYGGSFTLTKETRLGAKGLVAVLMQGQSRFALLKASLALALGHLADEKKRPRDVHVLAAERVRVTAASPVPVEIDGDEGGTTPIEVTADGPCVRLIVPAAYVAASTNCHANRVPSSK